MFEIALATTVAPRWDWFAVGYFFLGGLAAGCLLLGLLLDRFGRAEDRATVRRAWTIPLPCVLLGSLLLVLDLARPERFWHMLLKSHGGLPLFKAWSPMSVGAWALGLFSATAAAAFVAARADARASRGAIGSALLRGPLHLAWTSVGAAVAFFLAAYTGVLLAVTNRPGWSETPLLGLLFLLSATSSSAALLVLLARPRPSEPSLSTLAWLESFDAFVVVLEVIVLGLLIVSLGPDSPFLRGFWGALLAGGVGGLGLVVPLLLRGSHSLRAKTTGAALVLLGGLLLRVVIVFSVETL